MARLPRAVVPRSMRARTMTVAVLATAAAVIAIGVAISLVVRDALVDEVDRALVARANFIASQLGLRDTDTAVAETIRRRGRGKDTLELLLTQTGRIRIGSDRSGDAKAEIIGRRPPGEDGVQPYTADLSSFRRTAGSESMRVLVIRERPCCPKFGSIVVASSLSEVDRAMDRLRRALLVAGPALVGIVGGLVWLLVGRALRPVGSIRREAAAISGNETGHRVPAPGTGDEIAELAETINEMLDRLDAAGVEQRRFVADASHELRTPLAGLGAQIDVAMRHPEQTDWPELARTSRGQLDRLQKLVDNLLLLARWDERGEQGRPERELVDLDDLVLEEVEAQAATRPGVVDAGRVSSGTVRGDADELRRLVTNLLANALRHAAGRVEVGLRESDGDVVLSVADDGPGVPPDRQAQIFERFARLDEARGRDLGGSGLGLAICREIAARHEGSISVGEASLGGALFEVRLPSS